MKQLPISPAFRLRWPLIILMGSIGLTALAAFDAQRTVRRQDEVVNRALHEFSSFAAWSYGEHLKQHKVRGDALVFELSKVERPDIRSRTVSHLRNIDATLRLLACRSV